MLACVLINLQNKTETVLLALCYLLYVKQMTCTTHSVQCSHMHLLTKETRDVDNKHKMPVLKAPCCCVNMMYSCFMCMYVLAGMDCPRVRYPQLNDVVEADLAEQGYQVLTDAGQQVDKVIQLYEVTAQLT